MKYIIDNTNGSGSGCDEVFSSYDDAKMHMIFYSAEEKKYLEIVEIPDDVEI